MSIGTLWALCSSLASSLSSPIPKPLEGNHPHFLKKPGRPGHTIGPSLKSAVGPSFPIPTGKRGDFLFSNFEFLVSSFDSPARPHLSPLRMQNLPTHTLGHGSPPIFLSGYAVPSRYYSRFYAVCGNQLLHPPRRRP